MTTQATEVLRYRKKPVVIDAVQITNATFDDPHPNETHIPGVRYDFVKRCVFIKTLEGEMRGDLGDWIITGVKGEHYPCKPDIFAATYEALSLQPPPAQGEVDAAIKRGCIPEGFVLDCAYVPSGADCHPNSPHCSKLVFIRVEENKP